MAGCGGENKQSTDFSKTDVKTSYSEIDPMMQDSMDIEGITVETNDTLFNQGFVLDISQTSADDLIAVDVRKSYSSKKELILQDFMDVEYITLETNDNFLNQGMVQDIGKEIILVTNRINDGDIFVYDIQGKALRKINHKGQGPGEYTEIFKITLDESNGEMFVFELNIGKIFVYDLYGNFKRSFNPKNKLLGYAEIFNYDNDNLICYDKYSQEIAFVLMSKLDGRITKEINIPFKERKSLLQKQPISATDIDVSKIQIPPGYRLGGRAAAPISSIRSITPYAGHWILLEISSDTVYTFLPDYSLHPLIVRTPSVQSMDPEVMLFIRLISDRYYFMETIKNDYNFNTNSGFPATYLIYDKQEKAFSGYTVYNGDYSTKNEIYMIGFTPVSHESASWYLLQAYQLVDEYKKGQLKEGKLKEIAAKLDPEDNPVIMLVKHKK